VSRPSEYATENKNKKVYLRVITVIQFASPIILGMAARHYVGRTRPRTLLATQSINSTRGNIHPALIVWVHTMLSDFQAKILASIPKGFVVK